MLQTAALGGLVRATNPQLDSSIAAATIQLFAMVLVVFRLNRRVQEPQLQSACVVSSDPSKYLCCSFHVVDRAGVLPSIIFDWVRLLSAAFAFDGAERDIRLPTSNRASNARKCFCFMCLFCCVVNRIVRTVHVQCARCKICFPV